MSTANANILTQTVRAIRGAWRGAVAGFVASTEGLTLKQFLGLAGRDRGEVTQPMAQSSWVYAAVRAIATTIAGVETRLVRGEQSSDPITRGPAFDLLSQPSPGQTLRDLVEQMAGLLAVSGEVHVFDPDVSRPRPRQLIAAGKPNMKPELYADGSVSHWLYTPRRGKPIPLTADWHAYLRLFNPYDEHRGLAPTEAARLGISQDYAAARYNEQAIRSGARPGGIWSAPQDFSPEQGEEWLARINAQTQGPENANRNIIVGGGMEYRQVAFSNVDLALLDGRRMNREEIFAVFGVPPVLGGVFDSAHYNVADAAQEIFIHQTAMPLAAKIEGLFNLLILPRVERGVRLVIDMSTHHVLQAVARSKIDTLDKMLDNGVPYNEAKDFLGLALQDQPAFGATPFFKTGRDTVENVLAGLPGLPAIETPAEPPTQAPDEESEPEPAEEPEDAEASAASERREEERAIAARAPLVRRLWRAHFARQRKLLLRRLAQALRSAKYQQSPADDPIQREQIVQRVVLNIVEEQRRLGAMVETYFPRVLEETLRERLAGLGWDKRRIDAAVAAVRRDQGVRVRMARKRRQIQGVEAVTRRRIEKALNDGLAANETVSELGERVRDVTDLSQGRINRIVRTETGQAVSVGRFLASAAAGTRGKGWLHGSNPRPSHRAAEHRYHPAERPIAFELAFEVGGDRLMHPRDPAGSAGEIVNCNCILVPTRTAEETR